MPTLTPHVIGEDAPFWRHWSKPILERRLDLFYFIKTYKLRYEIAPSIREMMTHLQLKSTSHLDRELRFMQEAGWIEMPVEDHQNRTHRKSRCIWLRGEGVQVQNQEGGTPRE